MAPPGPGCDQGGVGDAGNGPDRLDVLDVQAAGRDQHRQLVRKPEPAAPGPSNHGPETPRRAYVGRYQNCVRCHDAADLGESCDLVAPVRHRKRGKDQIENRFGKGSCSATEAAKRAR